MINQGFNLNDFQRNQLLAQQAVQNQIMQYPQFTPRSMRRNLYSVIEVQSDNEILNFKIESGITYIFLNENSDKIYIRQSNERGELVTYVYKFTQNQEDGLSDPVSKLERRMEGIEKMLGGFLNVQSKDSGRSARNDGKQADSEKAVGVAEPEPGEIQVGPLFDTGEVGGPAERFGGKHGKGKEHQP